MLGTQRGLEDSHGESHGDGREEEEQREQWRIPEGMQFFGNDEIQRAERRLMQGGENHAEDHERNQNGANHLERFLHVESFEHDGRELERKHRGVEHHAIGDLEHHRVWIAHDEGMPDVVGLAEIEHQRRGDENVSEEGCENRRPNDGMQALDIKDVNGGGESEPAGGQHDSAKNIEAHPDTPGKLIAEVGGGAQTLRETDKGGVEAGCHEEEEDQLPECELEIGARHYSFLPFFLSAAGLGPSARATSSRRCVIHQMPPSTIPPRGTKSGMWDRTRYVSIGMGSLERLVR